jgi:uncharacterized protein (TIGR03435 family)
LTRANVLAAALAYSWLLAAQSLLTHPTFEVVSVRPLGSSPPRAGKKAQSDEGLLRYSGITLLRLIANAYEVDTYSVIGPTWLETERFAIDARLPAGGTRDQIPAMLQAMLADRFHFAAHRETRDIPVFALVVAKGGPKMQPATIHDDRVGIAMLSPTKRLIKGRTDIDELIFLLKLPGNTSLADRPLRNRTGLTGLFDIHLEWTVEGPSSPGSPDSDAGPSIFSAIQGQLGLKLEPRKEPMEAIIVDRVEKVPTEN